MDKLNGGLQKPAVFFAAQGQVDAGRKGSTIESSMGLALLLAAMILGAGYVSVPLTGAGQSLIPAMIAASPVASDPWSASQTIEPSDLINELGLSKGEPGEAKGGAKPVVVCVGFRPLYMGAHVPGSAFHGAGQSVQGLADLKRWAQGIPRNTNVVIYCGCCPLDRCPNVRPALNALHDMGFTNLRVLLLPHDFATDWVEKGYPVEKGAEKYSNANR